ncbi:MMPL family transporter [Gymnodinialimonas sp. 2305UL16-5]|uniref:MMPL family transporter n=1 Tax=Gymnodinialimonas mytili TaxID=3126503 RepID=UPI0030A51164
MTTAPTRSSGPFAVWAAALIALCVTIVALLGAQRMQVEADVVAALRGNSDGYLAYAAFQDRFALGQSDEALLIQAEDLADPNTFAALEDLVLDLQFSDGVAEVVSLFSIPTPGTTTPQILSPPDAPLDDRFEAVLQTGAAARALVTEDRSAALLHVIATDDAEAGQIAAALPALAEAAAPLEVRAVGQQAVERQISFALVRDQAVVTPLAILICLVAGALILRSIPAVIVCAVPAICGVLWFTGLLGWLGRPLDPWLATLPTLVMVLAFADTLHLFYAARDTGLREAIRTVLPAAAMTSLTSALALASFAFAGTEALWALAIWGPVSMLCAFGAVALTFPILARVLMKDPMARPAGFDGVIRPALAGLRAPKAIAAAAILVALVLVPALNRAVPTFSLSEHIRESSPLGQDLAYMAEVGLGSASLFVEIADADGEAGLSDADLERVGAVARIVLEGTNTDDMAQVPDRFRAEDGLSVALPILLPLDTDPVAFGAALTDLQTGLQAAGLSDVTELAGQSLLAHEVVPDTVAAMRMSFYFALAAIALVVAIALRSIPLALLATAISALPMMAIEAVLVVTGMGMSMAGAFALTVAFGIAVDDTIHFLNRWRRSPATDRLADALAHAGPPMVASTLLMTLGFVATVFSATASLPEFGAFVILALWMALLADLGLLPGLMKWMRRV